MNKPFDINNELAMKALRKTGDQLPDDMQQITLYLVGGVAGMLTNLLPPSRTTGDCDVMVIEPGQAWEQVKEAAKTAGEDVGLKEDWLNDECKMYAWQMPLGWQGRSEELGKFGPLKVMALSRQDLIASKVMGAPKRIQDRTDLQELKPTAAELDFVEEHLRRVEAETEPGHCDSQKQIISRIRNAQ
ncbi:MAG: DUF6036 family nucleotidyltransferase [Phycisphaeraceae bacterium]